MACSFSEKVITTDYETGLLPVLRTKFKRIMACFFHYCQSILKWIRESKSVVRYRKSATFRRSVRRFMALALLPVAVTHDYMEGIIASCPPSLNEFISYWRKQWVERVKPEEWNVFNQVHRTNNGVEGIASIIPYSIKELSIFLQAGTTS